MNNGQPNKWYIGDAGETSGDFLYVSGDALTQPGDSDPAGDNGATNNYRTYGASSAVSVSHATKTSLLLREPVLSIYNLIGDQWVKQLI